MLHTTTYFEIRPNISIPFWDELPTVAEWLPIFEQSLITNGTITEFSRVLSDDKSTLHRVIKYNIDHLSLLTELDKCTYSADYRSERLEYNIANDIIFYSDVSTE